MTIVSTVLWIRGFVHQASGALLQHVVEAVEQPARRGPRAPCHCRPLICGVPWNRTRLNQLVAQAEMVSQIGFYLFGESG